MSLNCKEINEILSELDLSGSFIQQIVQPGYDSIVFYCYKAGTAKSLFVCLAPGACRLHETRRKIPKNDKPLRFMEFLKRRIKGCRINSCEQLGLERIIKLELSNSGESFFMFIRLWSSAANIVVTDPELKILDVFYRRPKRNEVTGGVFVLPDLSSAEKGSGAGNAGCVEKDGGAPAKVFEVRTFDEIENPHPDYPLSFNEKVDIWYSEHSAALSRASLLESAEKFYIAKSQKMENAIKKLEAKRESFLSAEQWKHQGDLILSFGHLIDGSSNFLECTDYDTGNPIRIMIDPKKNVQENAKVYYDKYKKALSGLTDLEHDIQRAKKELLDLEYAYEAIKKEPNPIRMQQLIRKQTKPRQQIEKTHPGLSYCINDWYLLVGRDADENDELLRRHVRGADLWLHVRDWPGGYVFLKARAGKTVPLEILLDVGNLAVYHSKARKARTADLYYTQVKYLRRAKNGPKGTVLPTQEKNLCITLDEERLRRLEDYQLDK